ncbi:MAG: transporter substrate-binding domain-containing protein [Magnetococcales bacterium]|nr:transporter substrate-binding domain-containing protein [Magnetococcales bacterium]
MFGFVLRHRDRSVLSKAGLFLVVCCLSVSCLVMPSIGYAEFVDGHEQEMVIAGLNAPPYISRHNGVAAQGIIIDLINEILPWMGIKPRFVISNWSRAFQQAKMGQADALIPTLNTPERHDWFVFPKEPLVHFHMTFFGEKGRHYGYDGTLDSVVNLSIGKLQNGRVTPTFDMAEQQGKLKLESRSSINLLAKAVAFQRLDLFIIEKRMGWWSINQEKLAERLHPLDPPLGTHPIYLAISKNSRYASPSWIKKINETIREVRQAGLLDRIIERHHNGLVSPPP